MADAGMPMVCGLGLILSGYEKPRCLQRYLELYGMRPRHVVFVDDFVMNCVEVTCRNYVISLQVMSYGLRRLYII